MGTRGSVLGASKPEENLINGLHDAASARENIGKPCAWRKHFATKGE
jgi:hypothetical protein